MNDSVSSQYFDEKTHYSVNSQWFDEDHNVEETDLKKNWRLIMPFIDRKLLRQWNYMPSDSKQVVIRTIATLELSFDSFNRARIIIENALRSITPDATIEIVMSDVHADISAL